MRSGKSDRTARRAERVAGDSRIIHDAGVYQNRAHASFKPSFDVGVHAVTNHDGSFECTPILFNAERIITGLGLPTGCGCGWSPQ